ncbi:MAG: hypothetical protein KAS32_26100 [Candidatus Peribacteraceae bacterium]|nr:hypothetical protein [Candidatus Peribacteraceae bacterium]
MLLLSGCNLFLPKESTNNSTSSKSSIVIPSEYVGKEGSFDTFKEEVLEDGNADILFFTGTDCTKCEEHELRLISWYNNNFIPVSVYKVDFDKEVEMRNKYNVSQKDTFVRLDDNGNISAILVSPSEIELINFLARR